MRSFKQLEWDPLLFAFHIAQTIYALFFNRAQHAKMALLRYAATIGYAPVENGHDVARILREVHIYAYVHQTLQDSFKLLYKLDDAFIIQTLDGFARSAVNLPENLRGHFLRSVTAFSDRIKRGESVRPSAILINLAAILQKPFEPPTFLPSEPPDHHDTALLTNPLPEFRRLADPVMQSPRDADAALAASHQHRPTYDRSRPAPSVDRRTSGSDYDRRTEERLRQGSDQDRRSDDRSRQDRMPASNSRRLSDRDDSRRLSNRDDIERLLEENAEVRRTLASAQSTPSTQSSGGPRTSVAKQFAGAADEPVVPAFSALRCTSVRDSDDSDPDVPSSFEQALTSHHDAESPLWTPSDVQPMSRSHNMPGRTGYRPLPPDYSNRYSPSRPF